MQPITSETMLPVAAPSFGRFTSARRELWRQFPAWMFFIYGVLLLNTELTNFDTERTDLAHTIVFPLSVFVLFQLVRFRGGKATRQLLFTSLALSLALPALVFFWHSPSPLSHAALLRIYEWSNFGWAALLIWHLWTHDRSHVTLFFGVGLLYGAVLENGGIILGFFHETNLTDTMVRPFVAPVATMIGWSVVLAMAAFITWELRKHVPVLRKSAALSALLLGTFATFLDLQIDPIATAVGCWVWHESLPPWFHGVPLVNFLAWMCALVPFGYVMFRVQELRGIDDGATWKREDLKALLLWSPAGLIIAALGFITLTLIIEGVEGPSWTLLNHFTLKMFSLF